MRKKSSFVLRVAREFRASRALGVRGHPSVLALCLLVLGAAGASAAGEPIGFVAAVHGQVDRLTAAATVWRAAAVDDPVWAGDTLRTGMNSTAKIVLVDDTTLGLGEDTELAIDNLVIGPEALSEPSILRQLRGQIRTRVGEAFGGTTRIEIHTPTAIMGVKGTEGTTRVDGRAGAGDGWPAEMAEPGDDDEISTLVRNWEGGITAALLNGVHLPVPPGKCRVVYRDRIGEPADCPDDFVPIVIPEWAGIELARLQVDLLVAAGPPAVSAGPEGMDEVVGAALLIEPPDPVLEDRTDADEFAGIDIDPLADIFFDPGEVGSDAGSNPLSDVIFEHGVVGSDAP